jgi:hypothetical protein
MLLLVKGLGDLHLYRVRSSIWLSKLSVAVDEPVGCAATMIDHSLNGSNSVSHW